MNRFLTFIFPSGSERRPPASIASLWVFGLIFGSICAVAGRSVLTPLIFSAASASAPLFQLLLITLLPVVFSFCAALWGEYWLLQPIIFGKAFLFAYVASAITVTYGTAGWLVRFLLMFTDFCTLPLLLWYWIQLYTRRRSQLFASTALFLVFFLLIGVLDTHFISPFLTNVIS